MILPSQRDSGMYVWVMIIHDIIMPCSKTYWRDMYLFDTIIWLYVNMFKMMSMIRDWRSPTLLCITSVLLLHYLL